MNLNTIYRCALAAAALLVTGAPLLASDTGGRIESSFRQSYVYRTYLKDDTIKVEDKEGVVTLTGMVSEETHKALAQETVTNLGVSRVDNQLAIKTAAVPADGDARICRSVILALQFHRTIDLTKMFVAVKDGVVTLTGEASNVAERELAAEYAKDIDGVTELRNEMTVAAAPEVEVRKVNDKLDDASITAQIKTALMTHLSTRSINARVVTRNGEVSLTGIARNDAEKAVVGRLAADIWGVTGVNNQMTIDPSTNR